MDLAHALTEGSGTSAFAAWVPLLIMGCMVGPVLMEMAKRKGMNKWSWFFVGFVPVVSWFAGIWLASLSDQSVKDQLASMSLQLQQLKESVDNTLGPSKPTAHNEWVCTCGMVNGMDATNCPLCGLKRDYLLKKETISAQA